MNPRTYHFSTTVAVAIFLLCAGNALGFNPADVERLRQAIKSSEILPRDYRSQINLVQSHGDIILSVYRNPESRHQDCKIDTILLASKVLNIWPTVQNVKVAFYDLSAANHCWFCAVPTSSVNAYAQGRISRDKVISSVSFSDNQDATVAKMYGALSYRQMIEKLGAVAGPLRDARAEALVRINSLQARGVDISELRIESLHIEDLARRGEQKALVAAIENLNKELDEQVLPDSRLSELDALLNKAWQGSPAVSSSDQEASSLTEQLREANPRKEGAAR